MSEFLHIQARLPHAAGLELLARLLAARPLWDIEVEENGLSFAIPLIHGEVDADLTLLEESCRNVERTRAGFSVELEIVRRAERPEQNTPRAAGPWRVRSLAEGESPPPPRPDQLVLPPFLQASRRLWAGESLLLNLIVEHLTPPPGAPETRGRPALVLEAVLPATAVAAVLAGASESTLAADETTCASAVALAAANARASALETVTQPFKTLARKRDDWRGRFGLIAVHLSPYLASRRLKILAGWLHPEGALIISGFAPGPQTAHLLRSAAKAGLCLTGSIIEGYWAAMTLGIAPEREELPPLTGSVVPDLVDLPEGSSREDEAAMTMPPEEEEIPDEDSLMVEEEEADEDEEEA